MQLTKRLAFFVPLWASGISSVAVCQAPPNTPVKALLIKHSRFADVSSPARQRESVRNFEQALLSCDKRDPWFPKALYDLAYDEYRVSSYADSIRHSRQVMNLRSREWPGIQFDASLLVIACLEESGAPSRPRLDAINEAINLIPKGYPLKGVCMRGFRAETVAIYMTSPLDKTLRNSIRAYHAYVSAGDAGEFSPQEHPTKLSEDYRSTTWKTDAFNLLHNLSEVAAERRLPMIAKQLFGIYRERPFLPDREICFAANEVIAQSGDDLSVKQWDDLLTRYPAKSPARAATLASSLSSYIIAGDCTRVVERGKELVEMEEVPTDGENPAIFFEDAYRAMDDCGVKLPRRNTVAKQYSLSYPVRKPRDSSATSIGVLAFAPLVAIFAFGCSVSTLHLLSRRSKKQSS